MIVSTKGRYALRLMLDLANHSVPGGVISLKDIAVRQGISVKYLEQIISILNKAGYVRSIRGPQGGYQLTREPEEYTVGMILRLTEGDLAPVECLAEFAAPCERMDSCATVSLWRRMQEAVNSVIDDVTLADLMKKENKLQGGSEHDLS